MNWNRADELLHRYYAGQTSTEEEQELKQLLSRDDLPPKLRPEQGLFHSLHETGKEETVLTDEELFSRLDQHLKEEGSGSNVIHLPVKRVWQMAAAVALLLIGYGLGSIRDTEPEAPLTNNKAQTEQLAQIQREVEEMKSLLSRNSPSQRLKAANYVQETGDADEELIQVLIQTMHFDENVNVRMAAVKALLHFQERPLVRKALIQSLSIQTDPNVQLQLIDGLVEMGEKGAVPQMQELLKNEELQKAVKVRLKQGIGILI